MEYRFQWFVSTCNNDFEASSTSLMSLWANIKFFPEPTGELYGWLLATLVFFLLLLLFFIALLGVSLNMGVICDKFSAELQLIGDLE